MLKNSIGVKKYFKMAFVSVFIYLFFKFFF